MTTSLERDAEAANRRSAAHRVGLGTTVMLGMLSAIGPLASDVHLPGLPAMAEALKASDFAITATITVCFVGFALGQLVVGGVSDRLGRRLPTLLCLALFAICGMACAVAPSIEFLLIARFFQGFFGAGSVVTARAAVRDIARDDSAAGLYSQLAVVAMFAPIIAPLLGGQVLRFASWRGLFWLLALIALILLVVASLKFVETLPKERRIQGGGHLRLLVAVARHPGFGQHLVLALCQGVIMFSYLTMSSLFLQREYDVSPQLFSVIFSCGAAAMLVGHLFNIRFAPKWGALTTLTRAVTAYFLATLLLLVMILVKAPLVAVAAAMVLLIFTLAPAMPNNMALGMVPFGAAAGTASALLGASQQLAGAIFTSGAIIIGASGMVMGITMVTAASIGMLQMYFVVRPRLKRSRPTPFAVPGRSQS